MQNRLKKLRLEKRLTLADVQVKTDIDFKILENFEKGLENGIPNSLAIWQKLANFLEVSPIDSEFKFSISLTAALNVIDIFVPVSPSGTGNTFNLSTKSL